MKNKFKIISDTSKKSKTSDLYFVLDRPGKYVYHYIVKDNGLKVIEDSTPVGIVSI